MPQLDESDKQWIQNAILQSEERMREHVERIETKLLTEFHKWASPNTKRLNSHTSDIAALYEELQTMRERIEALER